MSHVNFKTGTNRLNGAAPNANLAVVECTTGLLNAEKKLPQLLSRTVQVRKSLEAAGNPNTQLISILITTKSRAEVEAELEQAYQANILVATKEDIESALSNTLVALDANEHENCCSFKAIRNRA